MKKFWICALVIAIAIGACVFIAGEVEKRNEQQFMSELWEQAALRCAEEAEQLLQETYIQVESIDFDIRKIEPVVEGRRYIIYVDWYVRAEVYASTKSDREYWMTMVSGDPGTVTVDGKSISLTYMKDNFKEGCNLYYNNSAAMNGNDYHKDVTGKNDQEYEGYSEVRCSRCGNSYRSTSSHGLRVKKGMPCGVGSCK